jgi:hypothetical protein
MQVSCTQCQRDINIPDAKVPEGQAFNLTCPGCKSKFRVDQHLKNESADAPTSPPAAAPASPEEQPIVPPPQKVEVSEIDTSGLIVDEDEDEDEELEIYDDDEMVALILDDSNRKVWIDVLEEKGYRFQFAHSPEHAIHKMKFYKFSIVVLEESFGGVTMGSSPIYKHIIEMPMVDRRNIFVVLVGEKFRSTNNMEAFTYSVNLVINPKDFGKVGMILKKSIIENEAFYKAYSNLGRELGKI